MKMENNINADKEGMVKAINIQRNDAVMEGDVLIEIEWVVLIINNTISINSSGID